MTPAEPDHLQSRREKFLRAWDAKSRALDDDCPRCGDGLVQRKSNEDVFCESCGWEFDAEGWLNAERDAQEEGRHAR